MTRPQQQSEILNYELPVLAENPLLNPLVSDAETQRIVRNVLLQQNIPLEQSRAARFYNGAATSKRSANTPVKRERIIMDALGGDYLIRKRTAF